MEISLCLLDNLQHLEEGMQFLEPSNNVLKCLFMRLSSMFWHRRKKVVDYMAYQNSIGRNGILSISRFVFIFAYGKCDKFPVLYSSYKLVIPHAPRIKALI